MRSRITILCGFLLFSLMFATPARADAWSAFIAWLSDLDPKTGGVGVEFPIWCKRTAGDTASASASGFTCVPIDWNTTDARTREVVVKNTTAIMLGTLNDTGGTIFATPVLGIVEWRTKHLFAGAGAGFIHVGGLPGGGITRSLIQGNLTVPIPRTHFGFRAELNIIPKGFPAGAFGAGTSATGTEVVPGFAFVFLR